MLMPVGLSSPPLATTAASSSSSTQHDQAVMVARLHILFDQVQRIAASQAAHRDIHDVQLTQLIQIADRVNCICARIKPDMHIDVPSFDEAGGLSAAAAADLPHADGEVEDDDECALHDGHLAARRRTSAPVGTTDSTADPRAHSSSVAALPFDRLRMRSMTRRCSAAPSASMSAANTSLLPPPLPPAFTAAPGHHPHGVSSTSPAELLTRLLEFQSHTILKSVAVAQQPPSFTASELRTAVCLLSASEMRRHGALFFLFVFPCLLFLLEQPLHAAHAFALIHEGIAQFQAVEPFTLLRAPSTSPPSGEEGTSTHSSSRNASVPQGQRKPLHTSTSRSRPATSSAAVATEYPQPDWDSVATLASLMRSLVATLRRMSPVPTDEAAAQIMQRITAQPTTPESAIHGLLAFLASRFHATLAVPTAAGALPTALAQPRDAHFSHVF